VAAAWC